MTKTRHDGCTANFMSWGQLQCKECKRSSNESVGRDNLEWRSRTSELGGQGRTNSASSSGQRSSLGAQSSSSGVRSTIGTSSGGRSLRRGSTRNEAYGLSGGRAGRASRAGSIGLGGEVNLRNNDAGSTVGDGGNGKLRGRRPFSGDLRRRSLPSRNLRSSSLSSRNLRSRSLSSGDLRNGSLDSRNLRRRVQRNIARAVLDDLGVLWNMLSADANQVLQRLLSLLISTAPGCNTVDDVLGELRVGAIASLVSVVLALAINLEPGVHALGENIRRRNGRVAGGGRLRSGRAGERSGDAGRRGGGNDCGALA
ncbi:hypothetical protein J1614_006084 [Plenodomus biglobosus]|nr:hypothetical protein J1614_006084 [Plenodomus biglobosus]